MVPKITRCSTSPTVGKSIRESGGAEGSFNSRFASTSGWIILSYLNENGTNRKINPVWQIVSEH